MIRDCEVIPGETVVSQHRVLAMYVLVQAQHKKRQKIRQKECIRTWKLKGDKGLRDAYKNEVRTRLSEQHNGCSKEGMWHDKRSEEKRTRNVMMSRGCAYSS